ncbi:FxsA protein [gamma proteobacterium HTCC5015]|nr:FxsA protein [gamma proteobacterium HTCC5015]
MGFGRVFLFIFVFALLEAVVLGAVADQIGWIATILFTVLTAMIGSVLFRIQGLETWLRLNQKLQAGDMPAREMVEGVMLLLGGALLITPGFITDAIGFALLLPGSRSLMAGALIRKGVMQNMAMRSGQGGFTFSQGHFHSHQPFEHAADQRRREPQRNDSGGVTIEGESRREDD